LTDEDEQVRISSIDALRELGAVRAIGPLVDRLRHDTDDVCRAVAVAFVGLPWEKGKRRNEVSDALKAKLNDKRLDIRAISGMALDRLMDG
jgi:HEAT repeat protein